MTNGLARCVTVAAFCLLAVLMLIGCDRSRIEGDAQPPEEAVASDVSETEAPEADASETQLRPATGDSTEAVSRSEAQPSAVASINAPRFLVPKGRLQRLTPADAFIGELVDTETAAQTEVYAVAYDFLRALDDPKRAISLVIPEARSNLERIITDEGTPFLDVPSIRIARARFVSAREATVSVRLLVHDASTMGNLVVENRDNNWYIADMLLDLRELSRPADRTMGARLEPWADRSPLIGP